RAWPIQGHRRSGAVAEPPFIRHNNGRRVERIRLEFSLVTILGKISDHLETGYLLIFNDDVSYIRRSNDHFDCVILWQQGNGFEDACYFTSTLQEVGPVSVQQHVRSEARAVSS